MVRTQAAPASCAGLLPEWVAPVDALLARRAGHAVVDPLVELRQLGYLPDGTEPPAWEHLDAADWFALLRAVARRCPRLGMALAAARLIVDIACSAPTPDAIAARATYVRAQWAEAAAPSLRVAAALLAALSSGLGPDSESVQDDMHIGVAVPSAALRRVPGDLLAVGNGALWCLWNASAAHVESRPMFRRVLADFPVIRYRLLGALVAVLEAEAHAERAAADPDDGGARAAFRAACLEVRTETQQLCGGSGFMCESDYAVTLIALDECLRMLALLPSAARASRDRAHPSVRTRLEAWGVTTAEWTALAAFGSRPRLAD